MNKAAMLLTLSAGLAPLACTASITLEQVLSAPFPSNLIVAPTTGRFAWTFNERGSRNVWVAEPQGGHGYLSRAVTHYSGDDGQDIGELQFTPDGQSVIYVRSGDLEHPDLPVPNPAELPEAPAQQIWLVDVGGGKPRLIASGHAPAVSPKGDFVALLSKGQLWLAPVDGHEPPRQLLHTRAECDELRWAPDGTRLAFTSRRGDHSFVGVYSFEDASVRYLDPSTDEDSQPQWSADGAAIAFLRRPGVKGDWPLAVHRTAPQPWSIRVVNVASGQSRQLWEAPAGVGSAFHPIVAGQQLFWRADDQIIFPAEIGGWLHLYALPGRGGHLQELTPGAFEVEYVALSPDRTTLVYSSNEGDIDRRHVWKLSPGALPIAVTQGSGIETAPVITDDGTVALLRSDATRPLHPALAGRRAGALEDLAPRVNAGFPSAELVAPQPVLFKAADGVLLHGQLFLPPSESGARHPAILFLHGGPYRQMLLGFHDLEYYSNTYALNEFLASRGYVVLSVNYRRGIGYGLEFREALHSGAEGASEFKDVLAAGRYLSRRADVDQAHIGVWGGSYGGYLTAMALAHASSLFAAGVDISGVAEWPHWWFVARGNAPVYEGDQGSAMTRLAFESSPMASVSSWRSPVLFIHGDDDRAVDFSETVRLVEALRARHVTTEQLVLPDESHDLLLHRSLVAAYAAATGLFARRLMPEPASGARPDADWKR